MSGSDRGRVLAGTLFCFRQSKSILNGTFLFFHLNQLFPTSLGFTPILVLFFLLYPKNVLFRNFKGIKRNFGLRVLVALLGCYKKPQLRMKESIRKRLSNFHSEYPRLHIKLLEPY